MSKDNNNILAGGDVEVKQITLLNYKKDPLDLSSLFVEIQLFEDLYSSSLSGNITLIDTLDVINNFPIMGEEFLILKYNTAGFPDEQSVEQTFAVTKMTDQLILGPHKRSYVLHFMSPEVLDDINTKISKAYTGTPSKIIEKVLTSALKTNKNYFIEECGNNIKIVPPMWAPFKIINYVAGKAMTPDTEKMSNYLFFETNLGYRFASLGSLYSQPALAQYNYNNDPGRNATPEGSQRDVLAEMSKIYDLRIDTKFDQVERMFTGALSHMVWDHNLMFKRIDKRFYHYDNDFDKTNHLGPVPVDSESFLYDKGTLTSSITTIPFIQNDIPLDNGGKNVTSRIPLMNQLNMMKMDITVHGRTDIKVGDCVNITVGGVEAIAKNKQRGNEDYYNGKYLIVAIMHRITVKKHAMVMQVAKESINEPYTTWSEK